MTYSVSAPPGRSEVVEIGAHRRHKKQQQQIGQVIHNSTPLSPSSACRQAVKEHQ